MPGESPHHCRATCGSAEKEGLNRRENGLNYVVCDPTSVLAKVAMGNKLKTHKGARKRLKVSATGKVRYRRSFAGHLMSAKSGNRRRRLRKNAYLVPTDARKIRAVI